MHPDRTLKGRGLPRKFDKISAALQAARWRRNYFRLLFLRQALDGARRGAHIAHAREMLDWASGPQGVASRLARLVPRFTGRTAAERAEIAALDPRARLIFEELQKAVRASPQARAPNPRQGRDDKCAS
jgi:hypothetical protein